jgi:hypothetical protein
MALYPRRVDLKGTLKEFSSFFAIVHIFLFSELLLLSDGVVHRWYLQPGSKLVYKTSDWL